MTEQKRVITDNSKVNYNALERIKELEKTVSYFAPIVVAPWKMVTYPKLDGVIYFHSELGRVWFYLADGFLMIYINEREDSEQVTEEMTVFRDHSKQGTDYYGEEWENE